MKAPDFKYARPQTLSEAQALYESADGEAEYIAGGHSIVPALALRLQAPELLIDLASIAEVHGVFVDEGFLHVGAMTRHAEAITHPLITLHAPLLSMSAPFVAHPAIRNRGTIGGSIALADPASEFPAVMLALSAQMVATGTNGRRTIPAADFFHDLYETELQPGEILTAIRIPVAQPNQVFLFDELARRRGDYAMVGCAISGINDQGHLHDPKIAFLSVGATPILAKQVASQLADKALTASNIRSAQQAIEKDLDPNEEPSIPRAMRLHLARVLLGRMLTELAPQLEVSS